MAEQTPEQQQQQFSAAQQSLVDRDALVERYRPFVFSVVKQVLNTLPARVDFEELVSYGMVGLLEAADRYDPRRKASFITFSHYRIKGAIFDGLRQMGILTRTPNDAWVRRESVVNDLLQTASDDESENPATGTVDDEIQGVSRWIDSLIPAYLLSLSDENAPDVADSRELPDKAVEFQNTIAVLRNAVGELPPKEKNLIEALYFKQITTTELAKQMGVNKSWVSRLHAKAVERLRQKLVTIGFLPSS
ncbi:MAG TPA: sigma-70 family RNA polymerase sigma factor [Pyrinomonadaceae bacterium]|nr:sigma-70 family RNA polymerase sigma factor [Pyrinomonadaceae bacterium]